jgi:LAGLIDADG DNA endonuclease family protein
MVWDKYGNGGGFDDGQYVPGAKGGWRRVSTQRLASTAGTLGCRRYGIAAGVTLQTRELALPIDPYIFGYWLGDGHAAAARFTVARVDFPEFRSSVRQAGYFVTRTSSNSRGTTYSVGVSIGRGRYDPNSSLHTRLRQLGVLGNKHVPTDYLVSSPEQRLSLLQGLMDSDGAASRPHGYTRAEFGNSNRTLAYAVLYLVRSLGWKATLIKYESKLDGRPMGQAYKVCWTPYDDLIPFRLSRKAGRVGIRPERRSRTATAKFVSVELRHSGEPLRTLNVSHQCATYLAGSGLLPILTQRNS